MRFAIPYCCAVMLALGLVGCKRDFNPQGRNIDKAYRVDVDAPEIYTADGRETAAQQRVFRYDIGTRDRLQLVVERHEEFSGEFVVAQDGTITLPLSYDRIEVNGKSIEAAEADVAWALQKYCKQPPQVHIEVLDVRSKKYVVLGQTGASTQGFVTMPPEEVRLMDALLQAQVPANDEADLNKVYVITPDRYHPTYVKIDAERVLMGRMEDNVVIHPGDIIYVPTRLDTKVDRVVEWLLKRAGNVTGLDYNFQYIEDLIPHRDLQFNASPGGN